MLHFTEKAPGVAGLIPQFFSDDNPAAAVTQLDKNYQHGGGAVPFLGSFGGFELDNWTNPEDAELIYRDDPPLKSVAYATLHENLSDSGAEPELLILFEGEWLAIIQKDGEFNVYRVD